MSTHDLIQNKNAGDVNESKHKMPLKSTTAAKDAFEGQLLIDRLLLYYSKFEGSRDKAARYAQKLLDLGHIESLKNNTVFEDSSHVYRWTDANKVVSGVHQRSMEARRIKDTNKAISQMKELEELFGRENNAGKSVFKILIETENCEATEIQANIKASPGRSNKQQNRKVSVEPNTLTTIEEDSFFGRRITKTLSYLNSGSASEEKQRLNAPYITDVSSPPKNKKLTSFEKDEKNNNSDNSKLSASSIYRNGENVDDNSTLFETADENGINLSPRKKPFKRDQNSIGIKQHETTVLQNHKVIQTPRKNASDLTAAKEPAAGTDVSYESNLINQKRHSISPTDPKPRCAKSSTQPQSYSREKQMSVLDSEYEADHGQSNGVKHPPTMIASTQTSEKSMLEASKLFKETKNGNGKRSPSPAPRTFRKQIERKFVENEKELTEQQRKEIRSKELRRFNGENQTKKTRFSKEISETSFASCESLNVATLQEHFYLSSEREMSLHSNGNADEASLHNLTNGCEEARLPMITPPPSPSVRFTPPISPKTSPMKSLFWTKISNSGCKRRNRKVLWDELDEDIIVDEEEFEQLFSKPPANPQTPRIMGQLSDNGRVLKVLRMERSRQVGIRASSVRLPIEEIHDAIINMDDEKLGLDALQALCDVRPTPEELDLIADAIKSRPNAILDKPEQFILMLAMIPSLDERIKCWIFAKKFPDKLVDIQDQLLSLNEACSQIIESGTMKKVLEIVLILGNQMNRGTQRGDAFGYYLDILPKLKDVKSKKGDSTLLHYVVKLVRQQMKMEGTLDDQLSTPRGNEKCGLPEPELLHRAISVSLNDLGEELERQVFELSQCKEKHLPAVIKESTIPAEAEVFQTKFDEFLIKAAEKLRIQAQLYQDVILTVEDFHYYFISNSETKSKEAVFSMLRSVSDFSDDFRSLWSEVQKLELKEEFYKLQKYKKERKAEIQVRNTPSALKERFLSRRRLTQSQNSKLVAPTTNVKKEQKMLSVGSTIIPKRNYKFEDRSQTDKSSARSSRTNSSEHREDSSTSFMDRAVENSYRLEIRMQELRAGKC